MSVPKRLQIFGKEWLREPLRVGAISPSGRQLAAAITEGLGPTSGRVLELGPGTGAFTQAVLDRGVDPRNVTVVELGIEFAQNMRAQFPDIRTVEGDAVALRSLLDDDKEQFDHIICGLPLLSISTAKVYRILRSSFRSLKPEGTFRLFTYSWKVPVPLSVLDRLKIHAKRGGFALSNIPPATVYRLTRNG